MSVRPLTLLVVVTACLGGSFVALARETPPHAGNENTEVLLGGNWCSADAHGAWNSLSFSATGDLFQDRYWGSQFAEAATPAETCDRATQAIARALDAGSCTQGRVEIYDTEDSATRSFQFSCSGPRSRLVALIAEISAAVLRL